jgi:uncharacterized protein
MRYIKCLFVFTLLCFSRLDTFAQEKTVFIKALASDGGKIKLRWGIRGDQRLDTIPYNADSTLHLINVWKRYINKGFIIERRRKNSTIIERVFTVKPDSLKLANAMIDLPTLPERQSATALKMSVFGKKVEFFPTNTSKITLEKEIKSRLFGTMVASAISFKATCYAGLGLVDDTAVPNIIYEYTISESSPPDARNLYSAKVEVENVLLIVQSAANQALAKSARTASGQRIASVLQAPPVPIAKFGNKKVELKWRWQKPNAFNSHQDLYYGYYMERKLKTATIYKRLNALPYVSSTSKSDSIVFVDQDTTKANTELINGNKYEYRLVGKTYFDDEIISLQTVSGTCEDDTRYYPEITKDTLFPITNQVELKWKYPSTAPVNHFKSFAVGRALKLMENTVFQKIPTIGGLLTVDSTIRTAMVSHNVANSTKTAYYVVIGKDKYGKEFYSFPILVQGVDTLGPATPVNVAAIWNDTTKTAKITWTANTESDLLGYKIFRALPGQKPIAISDTAINKKTVYIDTIKVENLKMAYYVMAFDKQYNPSNLSLPAILKRPDKSPPVKPSFKSNKINQQGQVEHIIIPSPSTDVAKHKLWRLIDTSSTVLSTWNAPVTPNTYLDNNIVKGGKVTYIIEAVDSSGNSGRDTIIVNVPSVFIAKPQFTILNSSSSRIDPSIKLNWDYSVSSSLNEVLEIVILKSDMSVDPSGKLSAWKILSGEAREVTDYDINYERTYKYGVKVVFKDGSVSQWLYTSLTMPTICGAAKYLDEQGKFEAGSKVVREACSLIRLLPGFHAKQNSFFRGVIKPK